MLEFRQSLRTYGKVYLHLKLMLSRFETKYLDGTGIHFLTYFYRQMQVVGGPIG